MESDMLRHKILIVDDVSLNIEILVEILFRDHEVHTALDGATALEMAESMAVDLILLDVMMPDIDGFEVCKRLKSNPLTQNIPIIFVTSMDEAIDEAKGFDAGCVDYITKPVNPAIVQARVKTHLSLGKARARLKSQNSELKKLARLKEDVERIARHDLKNPLTGIFSGIEFLESFDELTSEQAEVLGIIHEAARKMLRLINGSLDLFKMEQNIYRLVPEDVELVRIIKRIEQEMKSLIHIKKSRINIYINNKKILEENVFNVRGESLLFYSMLANLIKNAAEATPGKAPIEVFLEKKENGSSIGIHNMGAVPESLRDTFFDKYTTLGKSHGTGLGTYSAKLIAQTLGGNISMISSLEKGTLIRVCLTQES